MSFFRAAGRGFAFGLAIIGTSLVVWFALAVFFTFGGEQ